MRRSHALLLIALCFLACGRLQAEEKIAFNRDVRAILSNNCFACHGFDAKHREANLRLDTFEGATAETDSGAKAIVPGDLAASELWRRINSTDESEMMPPPDSHKELTAAEKETLKKWIEQGASYQKHWAFEPIVSSPTPELKNPKTGEALPADKFRVNNFIDAFLAQRLAKEGLTMSPEADKPTLIRRVSFALTGLPPTPAEIDAYLKDESPKAYENMVDRYLASQRYGEEMARHWLDVARYADTHGLHLDNERQMWAYRDWVIAAFNKNQPFNQFSVEQIAGDLLPNPSNEQLVATGFNRCNVTTSEGGSINDELIFRYAVDRASTTVETWLGLTAGCAVCHDHKFDPISQKEFYSLYAFFHSAADPAMDGNALLTQPVMRVETPAAKQRLALIDEQIAAKQKQLEEQAVSVKYTDPASLSPLPPPSSYESVWMDDEFPAGGTAQGTPGHPTTFVTADDGSPVFSGKRALKRSDTRVSQDVWSQATVPVDIPNDAKLFAYVWIDPKNPPKSVMLQYHRTGWQHRAVWGDYGVIPWGAANTPERVHMGELPKTGEWVRLEVPAEKLGLKAGDRLTGFATTQFGGTVFWDKVGVVGVSDPANDPQRSFLAWWKQSVGKDTPGIAPDLNQVAKNGPEKGAKPEDEARLRTFYLQTVCVDTQGTFKALNDEIAKLRTDRTTTDQNVPSTFIFRDLPTPRKSFVMLRGAYDKPGDEVQPGVPAILPQMKLPEGKTRATRLELANWIVSPENPLTARVTVNRFWQQFFGVGLVKTSFDFGSQGEIPSHPELLDRLAAEFQANGWDVKQLTKLMLTSAAFRQTARVSPEVHTRDPENFLYARGPRFRLDAEQIRDNALFVSGLMNHTMGGKGVKPYQPTNIWEPVGFGGSNTRFYKQDDGDALYRRSIYTFLKRTAPPPFMANFDAPNREQFCGRRERSNTPLQALQLLNDVQHVEAARAFAERLLTEGGKTPEERIAFAFRTVLSRSPDEAELAVVKELLALNLARYEKDPEAAKKAISHGQSKANQELNPTELAAYTLIANMILNLDETVMRN